MNKPEQGPWQRLKRASSIAIAASGALALWACGTEAPVAEAEYGADQPVEDRMPVVGEEQVILAFGDSLFAGYELEEDEGYPERLEEVLRGRGINARVIDAGVSGDTTAAGLQRIAFVLDNTDTQPDLAIVELGGNDLLRGVSPDQTRDNLDGILSELRGRGIPILLMGMRAPPNYGPAYQASFDGLYSDLADKYEAGLVPFFMEPLFSGEGLFLPDRVHPTADGVTALVQASVDTVIAALPQDDDS